MAIGSSFRGLGDHDQSSTVLKAALALSEEVYGEDDVKVAYVLKELGQTQREQVDGDAALRSFERSLALYERHLGPDHAMVAALLFHVATIGLDHREQRPEQLPLTDSLLQRSLTILEGLPEPDGFTLSAVYRHLALVRMEQDRLDEAQDLVMRATEYARSNDYQLFDDELLGLLVSDLGRAYLYQARFAEAESLFRESLATIERLFGPDHGKVGYQTNYLAHALSQLGEYEEAEALFKRTIDLFAAQLGSPNLLNAQVRWDLAMMHESAGEYELAKQEILAAIPYLEQLNARDIRIPIMMDQLGGILRSQGLSREAVARGVEALSLLDTRVGPEDGRYQQAKIELLSGLGRSYEEDGDVQAADTVYVLATALIEETFGPQHGSIVSTHRARAAVLRRIGRSAEADSLEILANQIEEALASGGG